MHVLIVTDQHPASLGGVQVSLRHQRRHLERLGHTVSIAAPTLHREEPGVRDTETIALPSLPITRDREYAVTWPTARTDRALAAGLRGRPPVDLVHIQGDFWGAMIGVRAARGLRVPVVHTMHNNVDQGTRAVSPLAPIAFWGLRVWRMLALGAVRVPAGRVVAGNSGARGAWRYLAELAAEAELVTAPSAHFARELVTHGVVVHAEITPTGVDDEAREAVARREELFQAERSLRARPLLVWLGRMSQEKRILEFLHAVAEAELDADIELYGAGLLLPQVRALIEERGLGDRVRIMGAVSYRDALTAMARADALVQTSVGFETQGMTPFEAASLGTPTIVSDPNISADLAVEPSWLVPGTTVSALASTLSQAVHDLRAAQGALRVPPAVRDRFLQSTQTGVMLEHYRAVLAAYGVPHVTAPEPPEDVVPPA